jgi:hypothetical protein
MFIMNRRALCALTAVVSLVGSAHGAGPAQNAAKSDQATLSSIAFTSIAVVTSDADGNYTLIDSRFDETATAGALFGLAGAAINSSVNAGEDDAKADRFRETAATIDLSGMIGTSAKELLTARANPPLAPSKEEASHTLLVEIRDWGLIRSSRDDPRLRVFLNLSWKVLNAKGEAVFEKKRENAVGSNLRLLDEHTNETFKAEMEALAAKAGPLIAYQIIYR